MFISFNAPCVQCLDCLSSTKNDLRFALESFCLSSLDLLWHTAYFSVTIDQTGLYAISNDWNIFRKISHNTSSNCWSQCIKPHCYILRVTVHSVTKLPKSSIETPCITFDHPLYIKPFGISKSLQMVFAIRLSGFELLTSFLESIGSVMIG